MFNEAEGCEARYLCIAFSPLTVQTPCLNHVYNDTHEKTWTVVLTVLKSCSLYVLSSGLSPLMAWLKNGTCIFRLNGLFFQNQYIRAIFICLFITECFFGVLGNFLVCLTVYRNKSMHSPVNYYIVNLGICDFLVGAVVLPIKVSIFPFSTFRDSLWLAVSISKSTRILQLKGYDIAILPTLWKVESACFVLENISRIEIGSHLNESWNRIVRDHCLRKSKHKWTLSCKHQTDECRRWST
jgi:hypothetical protein